MWYRQTCHPALWLSPWRQTFHGHPFPLGSPETAPSLHLDWLFHIPTPHTKVHSQTRCCSAPGFIDLRVLAQLLKKSPMVWQELPALKATQLLHSSNNNVLAFGLCHFLKPHSQPPTPRSCSWRSHNWKKSLSSRSGRHSEPDWSPQGSCITYLQARQAAHRRHPQPPVCLCSRCRSVPCVSYQRVVCHTQLPPSLPDLQHLSTPYDHHCLWDSLWMVTILAYFSESLKHKTTSGQSSQLEKDASEGHWDSAARWPASSPAGLHWTHHLRPVMLLPHVHMAWQPKDG